MLLKSELERQQNENQIITNYSNQVSKCHNLTISPEDQDTYQSQLQTLELNYSQLQTSSTDLVDQLHDLYDLLRKVDVELKWIGDRSDREVDRDWAKHGILAVEVQNYYKGKLTGHNYMLIYSF